MCLPYGIGSAKPCYPGVNALGLTKELDLVADKSRSGYCGLLIPAAKQA